MYRQYFISVNLLEHSSGTCVDDATAQNAMEGTKVEFFFTDKYYDYTADPATPLSTKMNPMIYRVKLQYFYYYKMNVEVQANEVVYLNGTTETFYTIGEITQTSTLDSVSGFNFFFGETNFYLSNKYERYEQYVVTEADNVRRNLGAPRLLTTNTTTTNSTSTNTKTSKSEDIDDEYYYFYIVAQVGGVFAAMKVLFGFLIDYYAQKVYTFDVSNRYNTYKNENLQNEDRDELDEGFEKLENQSLKNRFNPPAHSDSLKNNGFKSQGGDFMKKKDNRSSYAIDKPSPKALPNTYTPCDFLYYAFCCCKMSSKKSRFTSSHKKSLNQKYLQLQKDSKSIESQSDPAYLI